jgi:lysozyme family protein
VTDVELIAFIVDHFEGGFVDDPDDPGKATNWGVTQAALGRARRLGHDATVEDVRSLSRDEGIQILLQDFVYGCGFDRIANWRLRLAVIDAGIHSGTKYSARVLQRILGLRADGIIGPISQEKVNGLSADALRLVAAKHIGDRLRLVGQLVTRRPERQLYRFGEGWCTRVATVLELIAA